MKPLTPCLSVAVLVAAGVWGTTLARADETPMEREALLALPRYGTVPADAPEPPVAVSAAAGPRLVRVVYVAPAAPGPGPTLLAPVIVAAPKARPKLIPQVKETPPLKNVKIDPLLTDEARGDALIQKHLSYFDSHILNGWIMPGGVTNLDRAKQAEAIERSRKGLNSVADDISLESDPAKREKLTELYEELYLSRPR